MGEEFERLVINMSFASSSEDSDADNNAAEDKNCHTNIKTWDTSSDPMDEGAENVSHCMWGSVFTVTVHLIMMLVHIDWI